MVKKCIKIIGYFLISLIGYFLLVQLCSLISVNTKESDEVKPVSIYIVTNGVHTDIVVPTNSEWKDWSQDFPYNNVKSGDINYGFLAIGWGDKGFYLNTPTWSDLRFSTAFKAATGLSTSAIHATYYHKIKESDRCKKIVISIENYKKLIVFIEQTIKYENNSVSHIQAPYTYGMHDAFYEAKGSYSIFYTCNTWTNQALKNANQKAALWTVLDTGIFRHYN